MIPYDDLVAALATWRARQGLPVARGAAAAPTPPPAPRPAAPARAAAPAPSRGAAPAPARTAPPVAPPRSALPSAQIVSSELDDFDDGALIEDSAYDPGGDDYVLPLGEPTGESTAIGGAPVPSEGLLTAKRGKRPNDW